MAEAELVSLTAIGVSELEEVEPVSAGVIVAEGSVSLDSSCKSLPPLLPKVVT